MAPWNAWSCKQYLLHWWLEYGRQRLFYMVFVGGWKVCFSVGEILGWSTQAHQYEDATKQKPKPTFHNTSGQKDLMFEIAKGPCKICIGAKFFSETSKHPMFSFKSIVNLMMLPYTT